MTLILFSYVWSKSGRASGNASFPRLVTADVMVDSLGPVALCDNVKLSVEALQLLQILGMENPKEFSINLITSLSLDTR